jgi:iron complex outermembrane receptor protein
MICTCHFANAQYKISGRITDKLTGEAISGATLYIPELQTGTVADKNGWYKLENLPKIKVIFQIRFLGYKSVVENVDLAASLSLNFAMEQAITEMNEVVVTGTSKAMEITRNPVPMITLDRKELQQNLNTNIIDAISRLPGVNAVTTGPNVSKPFIHGLGYNRVLTLFDGVKQEGQQWGDEHGIEMDENAIDRIEIVKGPASLTYGSDALSGVVNLLPAQPAPEGIVNGHFVTNYQSNNGLFGASVALAGNMKGLIWGGVASHKQATNYRNKYDGRVYGTAFNETDLSGYIGLIKQWGFSHLNFSIFDDLQEIPDGSRDSTTRKFTKQITESDIFRPLVSDTELNSYKITALHQHVQHYKLYSSSSFIFGDCKLGLLLGYQQNIRREFSHPEYPEIAGLFLVLNTYTYDAKYYFPETKGWVTTIGINGMYQDNTNKGTEFIIPNYILFDIGPFALLQKAFNKLDVIGGIRYDARIFNNKAMFTRVNPQSGFNMQVNSPVGTDQPFFGFNHTFSGMSGSIGVTYKILNEIVLKGNIARGFRSPNIAEISANGIHPGTLIYQTGNTDFKPEFSLQEDFGIAYRSDHISGNLDIFNNQISNYIFNKKLLNHLGQDSIVIRGNQTFKYQQAKAQLYGWEANLDIHPFDWLHFENSVSVVYAVNKGGNGMRVTNSSKYLPFIPPLHTSSELRANLKRKFKYFSSLYAKIGMEYYARQDRVYAADNTETPTSGYFLFNAGIGAEITNIHGKVLVNINILGNNITDVAYQSHLSRLKYFEEYPNNQSGRNGIYNMGRNIGFKLAVPLNFE